MIASVPFVAASTKVREECDETAGRVGYAVPCPTLLPAGLSATPAVAGCGFAVVAAAGQAGCGGAEWHDWIVGSSQVGNETTAGFQHLVVVAAPRIIRDPARAIDGPAMAPGSRVQGLGVVRIGRETMHWYFVPPNLNTKRTFLLHYYRKASYDDAGTIVPQDWATVGGTSLSSPVIAAIYALAGGGRGVAYPAEDV
jgi:hypothetical protein